VEEKSTDMDSSDGDSVEFIGRSSAAGGGASDRWTGFEYTPVHQSYR